MKEKKKSQVYHSQLWHFRVVLDVVYTLVAKNL